MPKISIIIAAYNVGAYLQQCLDSVAAQKFTDYEAVVVDDASTDSTAQIIAQAAAQNSRIVPVTHEHNQGLHLTRKTGVETATGEYAFFLDGDDDLAPETCKQLVDAMELCPADILHYGITVIGENNILTDECHAFEAFNNAPTEDCEQTDIVSNIYDQARGQKVDWRVTQRLYRTSLLKKAFEAMSHSRLERAEDGYECLVISSLAQTYRSRKDCRGYRYHYGRGVTGTSKISAEKYGAFCRQFNRCFLAAEDYAANCTEIDLRSCVRGYKEKATEILANDWKVRVPEDEKIEASMQMEQVFGPAITGRELYRFVRDRTYELLSKHLDLSDDDVLHHWYSIANSIHVPTDYVDVDTMRFHDMKEITDLHIRDLTTRTQIAKQTASYANQNIRIFVTTHKNVDLFDSRIMQPVQVGPKTERFSWAFHDDEGENIADLNPRYCELTTQYWAWKNINADYYGFCHYRRYFDFTETEHEENPFGEIMDDYIDAKAAQEYGLDDATIAETVKQYDVITTPFGNLEEIINKYGTPRALWEAAPLLHDDDLSYSVQDVPGL